MRNKGTGTVKVVGWTALFVALGVILAIILNGLGVFAYTVEQSGEVVKKTVSADNVIYNYEYFKRQHQDIQAQDRKIELAKQALDDFLKSAGPRENWDSRDKEEQQRLQANFIGLNNVKAEMKAEYNARSKMVNRSIFMGKDVPAEIE